jgi:hypothetical protein
MAVRTFYLKTAAAPAQILALAPNLWAAARVHLKSSVAKGGVPCATRSTKTRAFEPMSKRRRGYPSETHVKAGVRIVHSDKLLEEKLGRNDLCPCGSRRLLRSCCLRSGRF